MNSTPCIISFANNRGNYYKAIARLGASLQNNFNGTFIAYVDESSVGAPLHTENPYAFKVYCFRKALEAGYTKILYLDSSVYAIKNVQPAFDLITRDGYLMQEAGQYIERWCNDETKRYFNWPHPGEEYDVMYGNAGMLGLDFNTDIARTFFKEWDKAMQYGFFKGSWADHRHDMTCGSIIANRLGMKFQKGDEILQYAQPTDVPHNDSIIFYAAGM